MSKGSAPRPRQVERDEYERRWQKAFGDFPASTTVPITGMWKRAKWRYSGDSPRKYHWIPDPKSPDR